MLQNNISMQKDAKETIKVMHVLQLPFGGMVQSVLNLCKFRNITEPVVLSFFSKSPKREMPPKMQAEFKVLMGECLLGEFGEIGIPTFSLPREGEWVKKGIKILRRYDVVHYHSHYYNQEVYSLIKQSGIPYLVTLRWFSKFPSIDCKLVCPSKAVYNLQESTNDCVVIHNGIDLSKFNKSKHKSKQSEDKIIITRVCRPSKCADYFWPSLEEVLERCSNLELWIVGQEGESTESIKFLGVRRDIPEILAKSDIFAYVPYPRIGAHDLCVLEAMAMGVPCVVSDVECVNESITNEEDGILVPFGDQQAFRQALIRLIQNPYLRRKLGQNALKTVRKRFDVKEVTRKYEDLYLELLGLERR